MSKLKKTQPETLFISFVINLTLCFTAIITVMPNTAWSEVTPVCDLPQSFQISSVPEIPEISDSINKNTDHIITIIAELPQLNSTVKKELHSAKKTSDQKIEVLLEKIVTHKPLLNQNNLWLKITTWPKQASAFPKYDYFQIYTEPSLNIDEFPILIIDHTSNLTYHSFAYQTGLKNYDLPGVLGRYSVLFHIGSLQTIEKASQITFTKWFCLKSQF